jgi:hypothetical protein
MPHCNDEVGAEFTDDNLLKFCAFLRQISELWQKSFVCVSMFENTFVNFHKVGYEVLTAVVMNSFVFLDITPYSPLKFDRRFGGTCRLYLHSRRNKATCFTLVSCLAYSSTLKMEATSSSETSVGFQ